MTPLNHHPAVIVGAARSGTNLLRDLLCALPGVATWPCDEINYIWRHGHKDHPHDAFPAEMATPRVAKYVRARFNAMARRAGCAVLVEKTCANSLRVPFVQRVVPEARFLFLVRDGRDAVLSADQRWKAKLDLGYIRAKARYVPKTDLPYYATQYLGNRLARLMSRDGRLATWGPRFEGMDDYADQHGGDACTARQWAVSVERAAEAFESFDDSKVLPMQYEDLVTDPVYEIGCACDFLGINADDDQIEAVCRGVFGTSVGRWKTRMDADRMGQLAPILDPVLTQFGYEPCPVTTDGAHGGSAARLRNAA